MYRNAVVVVFCLLIAFLVAGVMRDVAGVSARQEEGPGGSETRILDWRDIKVIDGDTIKFLNIRLVGFAAAEVHKTKCEKAAELGKRAKERLEELVQAGGLTFGYVPCSCEPGTYGTKGCNWGRACGTLRANGRDVGEILIEEGLAKPFECASTACPRLPSWCDE